MLCGMGALAERRGRIFLSSPTDVTVERERAEAVISHPTPIVRCTCN
jgi:hypothetical protein